MKLITSINGIPQEKFNENLQRVKLAILAFAEYYNDTLSEARLKLYANALADVDCEIVEKAFMEIVKNTDERRMPMAYEIRRRSIIIARNEIV